MPRRPAAARLVAVAGLALAAQGVGARPTDAVRVTATEDRVYGRVAYRYTVENNSPAKPIVAFRIGEDGERPGAQLRQPPFGWTDDRGLPIGSATAPDGWSVEAVREDGQLRWIVEWYSSDSDDTLDIAPGEIRDGFGVIVFDAAPEYLDSHWTVVFANGERRSGRLSRDTSRD